MGYSPKNQRKFQKGPIIGQNEKIKIEKCLENKISKQHHNSFLIIHIYHKSPVPPNKTQHYQLSKIDKKEKIEQIKKIKTINQKEMKRKIKIKTINKKYQM